MIHIYIEQTLSNNHVIHIRLKFDIFRYLHFFFCSLSLCCINLNLILKDYLGIEEGFLHMNGLCPMEEYYREQKTM